MEMQSKMYSEREAFQRLHETYLILQHHNEEGLALRLLTEARLKELFQRDRQNKEILTKTAAARKEHFKEMSEHKIKIKELEVELSSLR